MTKSISIDINRIDISEDEISKLYSGLLDSLLVDRTRTHYSGSTSYLVWGTDDYSYMGESYAKDKPITPNLVTGENNFANQEPKIKRKFLHQLGYVTLRTICLMMLGSGQKGYSIQKMQIRLGLLFQKVRYIYLIIMIGSSM